MGKLLLLPLFLIITASIIGTARNAGYVNVLEEDWFSDTSSLDGNVSGTQGLNETETGIELDGSQEISMTLGGGVIVVLLAGISLLAILGIQVMGSGLSGVTVLGVFKATVLLAIWGLFSTGAINLFLEIPLFGMPFYFLLTLLYSFGVLRSISGV